jgi:nitrogen fixation/metabolism regulation signal transduction histidine kinase
MMRRALLNCLLNAIEAVNAHRPDGPPAHIHIRLGTARGMGVVEVSDDGPGVDPAHLAQVFDPYFTTKETGTGLGLAIVKKIVLDHGGSVVLENRADGPGCRVRIELPLVVPTSAKPA